MRGILKKLSQDHARKYEEVVSGNAQKSEEVVSGHARNDAEVVSIHERKYEEVVSGNARKPGEVVSGHVRKSEELVVALGDVKQKLRALPFVCLGEWPLLAASAWGGKSASFAKMLLHAQHALTP